MNLNIDNRWNYDIDSAKDLRVTKTRIRTSKKGKKYQYEVVEPLKIIGCLDGDNGVEGPWVAVTCWLEPTELPRQGIVRKEGRWSGLTCKQNLLAWMYMPEHPKKGKKYEYQD